MYAEQTAFKMLFSAKIGDFGNAPIDSCMLRGTYCAAKRKVLSKNA